MHFRMLRFSQRRMVGFFDGAPMVLDSYLRFFQRFRPKILCLVAKNYISFNFGIKLKVFFRIIDSAIFYGYSSSIDARLRVIWRG